MKLIEVSAQGTGVADLDGTRTRVNLTLIEEPAVGDFVIVHAGYAIERLDVEEAEARLALFEEIAQEYQGLAPLDGGATEPPAGDA
jgi:hydrogenase expression/formation protein HypC